MQDKKNIQFGLLVAVDWVTRNLKANRLNTSLQLSTSHKYLFFLSLYKADFNGMFLIDNGNCRIYKFLDMQF